MRLEKDQKAKLLEWVAEGLRTDEINKRAAQEIPPFNVSRGQVAFFRETRGIKLSEIAEVLDDDALTTGLAIRAERVRRLQLLAGLLEDDLFAGGTWVDDVKGVGGMTVHIEKFNGPMVEQYRGVLDDIAREMGDRKAGIKLGGDRDNPVEVVHFYIPDNGRPHPGRQETSDNG